MILYQFTHQTFLEYFAASYLCRIYTTPAKLLSILQEKIEKREWDNVAQLAIQIQNEQIEDAGDLLLSGLVQSLTTHTHNKHWNVLSFIIRCLKFIIPSPKVMQEIVFSILQFAVLCGKEQAEPQRPPDVPIPSNILLALLNSHIENRKAISTNMVKLFKTILSSTDTLGIVITLEFIFTYERLFLRENNSPALENFYAHLSTYSEEIKRSCTAHSLFMLPCLAQRIYWCARYYSVAWGNKHRDRIWLFYYPRVNMETTPHTTYITSVIDTQ